MRYVFKRSLAHVSKYLVMTINIIIGCCSLVGILLGAYLFGFQVEEFYIHKAIGAFNIILVIFCILLPLKAIFMQIDKKHGPTSRFRWSIFILLVICLIMRLNIKYDFIYYIDVPIKAANIALIVLILITSIMELSHGAIRLMSHIVNPMGIFVFSFLFIILVGAVLLNFPNSTYQEGNFSLVNALSVSTSATCVTGLCPVEFTETFTLYGQLVILALIQVGGLGIITITSFFALSLLGALPFNSSMMIKDLISEESSTSISSLVLRIIYTTLAIEVCGAILIFFSLGDAPLSGFWNKFYFSAFHAISAFCNAGFSNFPGSLGAPSLVLNNSLYYIVSTLIILGGIGFPVYTNLFHAIAIHFRQLVRRLEGLHVKRHIHTWDINSIIVIRMTFALLVLGTAYFLIFEYNGMLAGLPIKSKIAQAFFNSVLPRTAGFTSQDISTLTPLTFIIIIFLMWVGGAPQSTAGGIKVTTLWIMIKNAYSQIRGRDAVEIHQRSVSPNSVKRAFAVVFLTTAVIFVAFIALLFTEPEIAPHKLLFETFSAIGTVGSSMNVTPLLSDAGKIIITLVMFIGRIGIITVLAAFFRQNKKTNYRYPSGDLLVN